jgi:hypothetical protein
MRGMSTSIWIWIIGGLVVAMLTFTLTFQSLVSVGETSNRNEIVDQFENVRNTARLYCMKGQGSMTTQKVSLSGVRAIYAADSRENPGPRAPNYISESETEKGDYMCLKFEDSEEPYTCYEMRCPVNITYMGTPLKGTDMYVLGGEGGSYQFDLTLRKKSNAVRIKAEHRP